MSSAREPQTLATRRLKLRPFTLADAARVQELAGDRAIADTTLTVPHPYEQGMAEAWIATHGPAFKAAELLVLAMTLPARDTVIGAIGLKLETVHGRGTLGYWVGREYWGRGYCTEAARALLAQAFGTLGLNKIDAECLCRNPASARVLVKLGMTCEGTKRQHYQKWGKFEDVEHYGLLRGEYGSA